MSTEVLTLLSFLVKGRKERYLEEVVKSRKFLQERRNKSTFADGRVQWKGDVKDAGEGGRAAAPL